jgi:phenylalanyl-tRNA synthetase beta chain
MRISLSWLSRYVDVSISSEELAQRLTNVGFEVEKIEYLGAEFNNFVVGEVVSVQRHPNADKLSLCLVQTHQNSSPVQIVCGAPNVLPRQKVAVGLVGATVPKNQHDPDGKPFTLSKVKIRGEESNGMICSEYELGIGPDRNGIMILNEAAEIGTPLSEYLGIDDTVFEVAVTPNRSDCLSHIGIAREVSSLLKKKLRLPTIGKTKREGKTKKFSVSVDNRNDCPRYSAQLITGVTVAPSPHWLQALLQAVGIRPINNLVDITNFVMYECGQPLHAFDFDSLEGSKIVVRNSRAGEKLTTLDGNDRALNQSMLVICDSQKPIALAGIMGGKDSAISGSTRAVLLESACFSPKNIRASARFLGMTTDASYRFERGTDPNGTLNALRRAAILITEIAGGTLCGVEVDERPKPFRSKKITLRSKRVNEILGTNIQAGTIKQWLGSIEIKTIESKNRNLRCDIPTFRTDLEQEIDLIEEVARLYGYSNIDDRMESVINFSQHVAVNDSVQKISHFLEGCGFCEIISNSLMSETKASFFSKSIVEIKNPNSKDLAVLRPSSIPSLLETVFYNQNHGVKDIRIYELGRTYLKKPTSVDNGSGLREYEEKKVLSLAITGNRLPAYWSSASSPMDIFDLKGITEALLNKILLDKFSFIYYDSSSSLTNETIGIEINGTYVGFIGKVKPDLLKNFQIENEVYVAELSLNELSNGEHDYKKYASVSKFPSITRDLAFIIDGGVPTGDIESLIKKSAGRLLTKITLFDLFEGGTLPAGKKSVAFTLEFNSEERTLIEKDIETSVAKIVSNMAETFNAQLRSA